MIKNAPFIWTPQQPIDSSRTFRTILRDGPIRRDDGINRYFYFRREYQLHAPIKRATAQIFVDGRYQLFVNGALLGRGPARASTEFPRYDSYDLQPHLQIGTNTIGVLALAYGVDTAWYERATNYWQCVFGDGGLFLTAEVEHGQSRTQWQSDTSWRCTAATAWKADTPRIGWGLGFIEDYDARIAPQDWATNDFDDAHWDQAQQLVLDGGNDDLAKGFSAIRPFPIIAERQIPPLTRKRHQPIQLLHKSNVLPDPSLPIDRRLYEEEQVPKLDAPASTDAPATLPQFPLQLATTDTADLSLLFKFDKLHSGYPFIELQACGGEIVEIAIAETLPGEFDTTVPTSTRLRRASYLDGAHLFRYTAKPGHQRFEQFELSAVRYLQLIVRNAVAGISVTDIGSIESHYPAEVRGKFSCSDARLERLWSMGAYTILQCSHDAWEDCPSREQRQWLGDGVVRYPASAACFGPEMQLLDRNFIEQCAESQRPDGLLQMFAPGDHQRSGIIIPDYSLHWVLIVHDYLFQTNDLATLAHAFPTIEKVLAWFHRNIGPTGLLEDIPYWHFIEWAHVGRTGAACAINALYIGSLFKARDLARMLKYESAAERYDKLASHLAQRLESGHWNSQRGLYVDELSDGVQQERASQQANALMIYFDIAPAAKHARIIAAITDPARVKITAVPPVTTGDPEFDPATDVVKANSFFAHFIYAALGKCERLDIALNEIRSAYAPMLVDGNDTLWESFEPTTSLCHAFSATPVAQFSTHLLGVMPTTPGFNTFDVRIQPCELSFAKGSYPTIQGDIEVAWQREQDALTIEVVAPNGTCGTIVAPSGWEHVVGPLQAAATARASATTSTTFRRSR